MSTDTHVEVEQPPRAGTAAESAVGVGADTPADTSADHGVLPMVLVVLATLLAVVSAATTWVRVQALDTDRWVDTSSELLDQPEVRAAIATYLVDELYASTAVGDELEAALPDEFDALAAPLAGALRGQAIGTLERVLDRPRLQQAWAEANRRAHEAFVAIVRNETRDNVSTADGAVVVDLGDALYDAGAQLGISTAVLDRIPEDAGTVTVIESQELADIQDTVRVLDFLSWFLFLAVVALYALAVFLAGGRRREVLRNVGFALVAGSLTLVALRSVTVRGAVDSIVDDPADRPLGRVVADVLTQLLSDMAVTGVVIGLIIAAVAALLGPHRWARATRRRLAASTYPGAVVALGAIVLLALLVWWSPGLIFQRWVTAITVLVLILGAAIALSTSVQTESTASASDESAPPSA